MLIAVRLLRNPIQVQQGGIEINMLARTGDMLVACMRRCLGELVLVIVE